MMHCEPINRSYPGARVSVPGSALAVQAGLIATRGRSFFQARCPFPAWSWTLLLLALLAPLPAQEGRRAHAAAADATSSGNSVSVQGKSPGKVETAPAPAKKDSRSSFSIVCIRDWTWPPDRAHDDRFFAGITYNGILAHGPHFQDRIGAELGGTLPVLHGLDLGLGAGSMFKNGGTVSVDARTRLYVSDWCYIGGGYVFDEPRNSYGSIGIGYNFFWEFDLRRGLNSPVGVISQIGWRMRL